METPWPKPKRPDIPNRKPQDKNARTFPKSQHISRKQPENIEKRFYFNIPPQAPNQQTFSRLTNPKDFWICFRDFSDQDYYTLLHW